MDDTTTPALHLAARGGAVLRRSVFLRVCEVPIGIAVASVAARRVATQAASLSGSRQRRFQRPRYRNTCATSNALVASCTNNGDVQHEMRQVALLRESAPAIPILIYLRLQPRMESLLAAWTHDPGRAAEVPVRRR